MAEFIHKYLFLNGQLTRVSDFKITRTVQTSVYEVMRVVGGVPLFYEDHLSRLDNSIKLADYCEIPTIENLFPERLKALCEANQTFFGNVELRLLKCEDNHIDILLGFIPHRYPEPFEYLNGIDTATFKAERKNPNAKVKHTLTRQLANEKMEELGVYELLLENNEGILTEGSRSNLFFIRDKEAYTAPVNMVLPGITRKYVIKAMRDIGFKVIENPVKAEEVTNFSVALISGTSPGVLSISQINNHTFDVTLPVIKELQQSFNAIVQDYLSSKSSVFVYNIG